jgi:drug/metabolite transporter superfamily protein YnfA
MSFTSEGAVYAAYGGAEAQEGPLWVQQVPGVSGNWWEVASPIQASRNGSIVAYALTALARYDPLGPKHAEVVVLDTGGFPQRVLLHDQLPNGTGVEDVHLSADGGTLVLITCDSENAIEVYSIASGLVTLVVNSSYPAGFPPSSTFTYAETCQVTASGGLFMAFPLWWGGSINQTAVAFWRSLPASPTLQPTLPPTSLWLSPGTSPALQDSIISSASAGPSRSSTATASATHSPAPSASALPSATPDSVASATAARPSLSTSPTPTPSHCQSAAASRRATSSAGGAMPAISASSTAMRFTAARRMRRTG